MKKTGLIFTSLALSCSASHAASDSSLSDDTLHIPHASYLNKIYDVTMKFQAPNKLTLLTATPLEEKPNNPKVSVNKKLEFSLNHIDVSGIPYRADLELKNNEFIASGINFGLFGKMHKGTQSTALGWLVPGSYSYAYSISDNGSSITGRSRSEGRKTAPVRFHYDTGKLEALNNLSGGNDIARATNNDGAVAGYGSLKKAEGAPKSDPTYYNAFYNKTGEDLVNIGTLGQGKDSRAYGINNNDVVVGWSASNTDNTDHVAFSYDANTSTMTSLGADILGGTRSFAFAINDSGQIAGVALTSDSSAVAFIYDNGASKNLGSLDNSGYSEARAINDKGQTAGWSLTADGSYQAFIHDGTAMKQLPGLGGDTKAYGINTHGHVVGDARDKDGGRHAFVYKDGKMIDLYSLLPAADQAMWKELREAYSISDDGVVVGRGRFWKNKEKEKNSSMAFRIQL